MSYTYLTAAGVLLALTCPQASFSQQQASIPESYNQSVEWIEKILKSKDDEFKLFPIKSIQARAAEKTGYVVTTGEQTNVRLAKQLLEEVRFVLASKDVRKGLSIPSADEKTPFPPQSIGRLEVLSPGTYRVTASNCWVDVLTFRIGRSDEPQAKDTLALEVGKLQCALR